MPRKTAGQPSEPPSFYRTAEERLRIRRHRAGNQIMALSLQSWRSAALWGWCIELAEVRPGAWQPGRSDRRGAVRGKFSRGLAA